MKYFEFVSYVQAQHPAVSKGEVVWLHGQYLLMRGHEAAFKLACEVARPMMVDLTPHAEGDYRLLSGAEASELEKTGFINSVHADQFMEKMVMSCPNVKHSYLLRYASYMDDARLRLEVPPVARKREQILQQPDRSIFLMELGEFFEDLGEVEFNEFATWVLKGSHYE